nr:Retrovirus-related Pol polyprotein from transposon TNT 1-94 [Ipomoea batatas]
MATRPPINSRSAPIDNIARNSARNATIGNAAQSSSASTTGSTATKTQCAMDKHNVWYLGRLKNEIQPARFVPDHRDQVQNLPDKASLVENQFGANVKCISSDNGLEFNMDELFSHKGIIHQTSCTYTPQQNSRVERKHDHLLSTARLRFQANLPEAFWGECIYYMQLT